MKKFAALIESKRFAETEECDVETSEKIKDTKNKTIKLIKKDCKRFIGVSILFPCVSAILIGIMIYFYIKSRKNNTLPY